MTTDYQTPREAALTAELSEARAKLAYLERMLEPGMIPWPTVVVEEIGISERIDVARMVPLGRISGALNRLGRYNVVAIWDVAGPEQIQVDYLVDGAQLKMDVQYALNRVLPDLHQRFLNSLRSCLLRPGQ